MNAILKQFLLISSIYLLSPTVDAFTLNDTISKENGATSPATEITGDTQLLVGQLQDQLDVTKTQAAGGTSALLQLAKHQLGADSMSALTSKIPGLAGLLGGDGSQGKSLIPGISSMNGVQSAFSALGMDSVMIQQFAPILLNFLSSQGVGSSLVGQLQSLWMPNS